MNDKEDREADIHIKIKLKGFYNLFDADDIDDDYHLKPGATPSFRSKDFIDRIESYLENQLVDLWNYVGEDFPENIEYIDDCCDEIEITINNIPIHLYLREP